MKNKCIVLRFFVAAVFVTAIAAVNAASDIQPVLVQNKFRIYSMDANVEDLNYLLDGQDVPVSIVNQQMSPFYRTPKTRVIEISRTAKQADGSMKRIVVDKVDVSNSGTIPLLIATKVPNGTGAIKLSVIKEDLEVFPLGSFMVINRQPNPLELQLNGVPSSIGPLCISVLKPAAEKDRRTVMFQLYKLGGQMKQLLFSNNWAISNDRRTMVIIDIPIGQGIPPLINRWSEGIDALTEAKSNAAQVH